MPVPAADGHRKALLQAPDADTLAPAYDARRKAPRGRCPLFVRPGRCPVLPPGILPRREYGCPQVGVQTTMKLPVLVDDVPGGMHRRMDFQDIESAAPAVDRLTQFPVRHGLSPPRLRPRIATQLEQRALIPHASRLQSSLHHGLACETLRARGCRPQPRSGVRSLDFLACGRAPSAERDEASRRSLARW